MDLVKIKEIFSDYSPSIEGVYKKSSVMVLLVEQKDGLEVLFNKRSLKLKNQPGDICFAGGRQEIGETPLDTVLREVYEELGISKENIDIIGKSDVIVTTNKGIITPFVGILKDMTLNDIHFNRDEVEQVFTVPLSYFFKTEPKIYHTELKPIFSENFPFHLIMNGKNYKFSNNSIEHLFYKYNEYVIWGITAKIISNVVKILKKYDFKG